MDWVTARKPLGQLMWRLAVIVVACVIIIFEQAARTQAQDRSDGHKHDDKWWLRISELEQKELAGLTRREHAEWLQSLERILRHLSKPEEPSVHDPVNARAMRMNREQAEELEKERNEKFDREFEETRKRLQRWREIEFHWQRERDMQIEAIERRLRWLDPERERINVKLT